MLTKYNVRSIQDAFAYIADCNLATVSSMAMLKSRKSGEYERQINIAQVMVGWIIEFGIDPHITRAKEVIEKFDGDVRKWVSQYDVKAGVKHGDQD